MTHEIRGKASKKKWLFPAITQVVIQNMDSLPPIPAVSQCPCKTLLFHDFSLVAMLWALYSSGGYFCERNACASLESAAKLIAARQKPSEIQHRVMIRGAESTSVRWSRHSLNFGHQCQTFSYTWVIWSAVPQKRQYSAKNLGLRADSFVRVNGVTSSEENFRKQVEYNTS